MEEHDHFERMMQVMDICHQLQRSLSGRSRELLGLSLAQLLVLCRTDRHEGQILVSELATVLSRTSHNVTGLVDGLVRRGLVTRRRVSAGDRRHVRISITQEGTVKLLAFREAIVNEFGQLADEEGAQRMDEAIAMLRELLADTFQWVHCADRRNALRKSQSQVGTRSR